MKLVLIRILFINYAFYIAYLSLTPTDNQLMSIQHVDKILHLTAYSLFSIIGFFTVHTSKHYFYLCIGIIFYSILIELGQTYVPGRMLSGFDILANSIGVTLGSVAVSKLSSKLTANSDKSSSSTHNLS